MSTSTSDDTHSILLPKTRIQVLVALAGKPLGEPALLS